MTPRRDEFQFPGFVGTSWTPWPDPDTGPMLAAIHLGDVDGRVECVGLELWAVPPPARRDRQGFTPDGRTLRTEDIRVPLGRMVEDAIRGHERIARAVVAATENFSPKARRSAARMVVAAEGRSPKGGRPVLYDRDHFAEVAKVYAAAWAAGRAGKPRQAVMDHWGVSADTAAKWIARCRHELGLLGPTERGKAGGVTPAAKKTRRTR